jgi:hypothetical protein
MARRGDRLPFLLDAAAGALRGDAVAPLNFAE